MRTRLVAVLAGVVLVASACSPGDAESSNTTVFAVEPTSTTTPTTTASPPTPTSLPASTTTLATREPVEIFVEGGEVIGGAPIIVTELGGEVWMVVHSDTIDHVHVHGYDLFYDVTPDVPADIMFIADIPGVFETEMEGGHTLIAELEVS